MEKEEDFLLCPWNLQGKNTGVGCHFLLQGIFNTQGLNPLLLLSPVWPVDSLATEPFPSLNPRLVSVVEEDPGVLSLGSL